MRTSLTDDAGNPRYTNRLINEESPYLRQHAHNPVDWYPWGDEAFDKARADNKPVFLSIGYSTCHWCHVMEHESFDNEQIAEYLNQHFVNIKLDREQRPDLDEIYMTGVQLMTGQGGWPMSSFLTTDARPFYAGTYFPPDQFFSLLQRLATLWTTRRQDIEDSAEEVTTAIGQYTSALSNAAEIDDSVSREGVVELMSRLDQQNGGFGGAPKFPNESQFLMILDVVQRDQEPHWRDALRLSLDKMYQGGIYDQVAGGFHRYTVDAEWLVPHFEKMLYNQAQLLTLYARAGDYFDDPAYRRIAKETAGYVLRDMTSPEGAFYSATDADSEGEEGKFFVWKPDELKAVLDEDEYTLVVDLYQVTEGGNFEGSNILNLAGSLSDFEQAANISLGPGLSVIREKLYQAREQREHPLRDEKVITGWNGMMIAALAEAGHRLGESEYVEAASRACDYLWDTHWAADQLWRISLAGSTSTPGNLEDYACLALCQLELYRVTRTETYLARALAVLDEMIVGFADTDNGGFFLSRETEEGPLLTRPRSPMDGATPSANSYALHALQGAYAATGELRYAELANQSISGFSGLLKASPSAFSYMLVGINQLRDPTGLPRWLAQGRIHFGVRRSGDRVQLLLTIATGWHINGESVRDPDLIATSVTADCGKVVYPSGDQLTGEVVIELVDAAPGCQVELRFQPCDESVCLAPESVKLTV